MPVPMAFRLIVRQGERDLKTLKHTYEATAAGVGQSSVLVLPVAGLEGDRFDVIFEPDMDAALTMLDTTRMWNGRIVFKDVPIEGASSPRKK